MVSNSLLHLGRQSWAATRLLLVLTVLLGIGYPLAIWAAGLAMGDRAAGQVVRVDGAVVGSRLLGQQFDGDQWFHGRPSVHDYDSLASGASNLGPENPDLISTIATRRAEVAAREHVDPASVPADAVTASGSGLDPHISPDYALLQAPRVAKQTGVALSRVQELIRQNTQGRFLGIHGEPAVNVLTLNVAVQQESR